MMKTNLKKKRKVRTKALKHKNSDEKRQKKRKRQKIEEASLITDRFSNLPEHLIHHIFSLVQSPKDVTRTSILSKKWKTIFNSFPVFDIDQRCFNSQAKGSDITSFQRLAEKYLTTRLNHISYVQRFKLHICSRIGYLAPTLNRWINSVISKNVQELDIHLHDRSGIYRLPKAVDSSQTLTSLKLYNIWFVESTEINLINLKILSIKKTYVKSDIIERFIKNSPLLEDIRLVYCKGFNSLKLSGLSKLNRVEIHECYGLKNVEIEAENLQTLWFCDEKSKMECKIILNNCENMRNLTLKNSNMEDDELHELIFKFRKLEKLILMECMNLERIMISNEEIKHFSIFKCKKIKEVDIDYLKLISLEYTGDKMPFSYINTSCLNEVKLSISPLRNKSITLRKFREFLNKFNGFKLFECSRKDVTIYEDMKGFEILPKRKYVIELIKSSNKMKNLIESFLLKIRLKSLSVYSSQDSEVIKFIKELIIGRSDNSECCRYYSNKCWRHFLKEAEITENRYRTSFVLKWKTRKDNIVG